jgi:hypothetical protein
VLRKSPADVPIKRNLTASAWRLFLALGLIALMGGYALYRSYHPPGITPAGPAPVPTIVQASPVESPAPSLPASPAVSAVQTPSAVASPMVAEVQPEPEQSPVPSPALSETETLAEAQRYLDAG